MPAPTPGYRPLPSFRPPVVVRQPVILDLCRLARNGYETPHKREAFGFLYGRLSAAGRLEVRRAAGYRGGNRTRSGVWFRDAGAVARVLRRREELARAFGLRLLGGFHSHVEVAGRVFRALSGEDRRSFQGDPAAVLEAVVLTWAGGRPRPGGRGSIAVFEPPTGYSYRVRLYAKRPAGIRLCPVVLYGGGRSLLLG